MAGFLARSDGGRNRLRGAVVIGVALLSLTSSAARAETARIEKKCAVFSTAKERAECACALEQGGWVTEVNGRWRWIYPRRHQERHCAAATGH
jgi:hypothetical protein